MKRILDCPKCGKTPDKEILYSGKNKVRVYCSSCGLTTHRIMEDIEYCAVDLAYKEWNKIVRRDLKWREKEKNENEPKIAE